MDAKRVVTMLHQYSGRLWKDPTGGHGWSDPIMLMKTQ